MPKHFSHTISASELTEAIRVRRRRDNENRGPSKGAKGVSFFSLVQVIPGGKYVYEGEEDEIHEFTEDDLAKLTLVGIPISIEHDDEIAQMGGLGEVLIEGTDINGKGKIAFVKVNSNKLGEYVKEEVRMDELKDVSLQHVTVVRKDGDVLRVVSKKPTELSFVKKGRRNSPIRGNIIPTGISDSFLISSKASHYNMETGRRYRIADIIKSVCTRQQQQQQQPMSEENDINEAKRRKMLIEEKEKELERKEKELEEERRKLKQEEESKLQAKIAKRQKEIVEDQVRALECWRGELDGLPEDEFKKASEHIIKDMDVTKLEASKMLWSIVSCATSKTAQELKEQRDENAKLKELLKEMKAQDTANSSAAKSKEISKASKVSADPFFAPKARFEFNPNTLKPKAQKKEDGMDIDSTSTPQQASQTVASKASANQQQQQQQERTKAEAVRDDWLGLISQKARDLKPSQDPKNWTAWKRPDF